MMAKAEKAKAADTETVDHGRRPKPHGAEERLQRAIGEEWEFDQVLRAVSAWSVEPGDAHRGGGPVRLRQVHIGQSDRRV